MKIYKAAMKINHGILEKLKQKKHGHDSGITGVSVFLYFFL